MGKSTLTKLLGSAPGSTRLREAWERLDPQPSLELGTRRDLLSLERRLLEVEAERFTEARALAEEGKTVWLDTGTLGPITYCAGLAWLTGGELDLRNPLLRWAKSDLRAGRWGIPDLVVHLDLPLPEVLARGIRSGRHPPPLLARHLLVSRFETEFFRGRLARILPRRVLAVSARGNPEALARTVLLRVSHRSRIPPAGDEEALAALRALEATVRSS